MYAVSLADGKEVWRYPEKADSKLQFVARPAVAEDGTVIIGSLGNDHSLIALDPANGNPQEKWIFTGAKDRWIGTPLIVGELVFAPNADGYLYVLDMQAGVTKQYLEKIQLGGASWSQPTTDGNLVYITTVNHHVVAVDPASYKTVWTTDELGGAAPGSPLVGPDGNLFVGTFNSEVVKVDAKNGRFSSFAAAQNWVWGEPVTDGEIIYFGDLEGFFHAIDSASGKELWSIQPDGPIVGNGLVMTDFVVFATESGSVYAVDRDGNIVWQQNVGGKIYTAPVANADRIVVAPMEAEFKLIFLDTNGNQINTFVPEN